MKTLRQAATTSSCSSLSLPLLISYKIVRSRPYSHMEELSSTYICDDLRQVGTDTVAGSLLSKGPLAVVGEKLVCLGKGALAGFVAEGAKGVLEHVGSVGGAHHGKSADVAEFEVLGQELGCGEDDSTLGQNIADAAANLLLGAPVGDGVGCHVEQQEVALLGAEDALVD